MGLPKIKREGKNSTLNKVQFDKSFIVKYFSSAEELRLLEKIASIYNQEKNEDSKLYDDYEIFNKLFNQYQYSEESDENTYAKSHYYLKNKYLYITTRGVINYLQLYEAQKVSLNTFFQREISELKEILLKECDKGCRNKLSVISLGCAISDKERKVFEWLEKEKGIIISDKIKYFQVDISPLLIQLGLNGFSSNLAFNEFEVESIVSDFWNLAEHVKYDGLHKECSEDEKDKKRNELFGEKGRLFLILGGTFGNYTEKEFLDNILELMSVDDEILISVKLQPDDSTKTNIEKDYENLPGNQGFLMEPLTYIPYYYGYARYHRGFLKTNHEANLTRDQEEIHYVSVVPNSICHAPFIKTDKGTTLRLAWSTRYHEKSLKEWISETYRNGEYGNGSFKLEFCKDNNQGDFFKTIQEKDNNRNYAIMKLKKVPVQFIDEVNIILNDYGLNDDQEIHNKIEKLKKEGRLDSIFFEGIKNIADKKNTIKKEIKEYIENVFNKDCPAKALN